MYSNSQCHLCPLLLNSLSSFVLLHLALVTSQGNLFPASAHITIRATRIAYEFSSKAPTVGPPIRDIFCKGLVNVCEQTGNGIVYSVFCF